MKYFLICLLFFVFQYASYAGIEGNTEITGKVISFDKRTVTLSVLGERKLTVSKRSLKKGITITAVFTAEEIMNKIEGQANP